MSEVRKVLEDAQTDLDNAQFILFGFIANPIRDVILKPALGVATHVVPAVASKIPFADPVAAFAFGTSFNVAKFTYSVVLPQSKRIEITTILDDANEFVDTLLEENIKELNEFKKEMSKSNQKKDHPNFIADLISFRGYLVSATVEFVSNPEDRCCEWFHAADRLGHFLKESGIDIDVKKSILTPRWLNNLRIMGTIQHIYRPVIERRLDTKFDPEKQTPSVSNMKVIATLMRYCTASYGKAMMEALEVVQDPTKVDSNHKVVSKSMLINKDNGQVNLEQFEMGSESLKLKVCNHVGIPIEWILYFNKLGVGGNMKLLRHYIAVDHNLKAIVFCIRGTQSFSGWNIDAHGMGKPFCGGLAHAGIADMAIALMENSKSEIIKALEQYAGYPLFITGQSLGSGAAALFNLLCHQDKQISRHKIECHAYGGPPVYYYHQTSSSSKLSYVDQAMKNSTLYVHREDAVPFLGVYTVHHLSAKLIAVDSVTSQMSILDRYLIGVGRKKPTTALIEAVKHGDDNLPQIDGAPKLIHPCSQIIWFMESDDDNNDTMPTTVDVATTGSSSEVEVEFSVNGCRQPKKYNMMQCDPNKFADLPILVSKDMFANHVPYQYEVRLNDMEKTKIDWQRL